jgi:hypothetical protein
LSFLRYPSQQRSDLVIYATVLIAARTRNHDGAKYSYGD